MKPNKLLLVMLSVLIVAMPLSSLWAIPVQIHHQATFKSAGKNATLIIAETEEVSEDIDEFDLENSISNLWIDYHSPFSFHLARWATSVIQTKTKQHNKQQLFILNRCILI